MSKYCSTIECNNNSFYFITIGQVLREEKPEQNPVSSEVRKTPTYTVVGERKKVIPCVNGISASHRRLVSPSWKDLSQSRSPSHHL